LGLWSHPNLFRARNSELTDLAIIFGRDVVLFSDKSYECKDGRARVVTLVPACGSLRALGVSRLSILTSFLVEAIFLAVIGGVIGSALVLVLSVFVSFPVINFQTFPEIVIRFHATPAVFVKALVCSGIMGLAGGLVPAIRASRVSPIEAMRA
jgi:putative ABC transport system permease protein